MAPFCVYQWVSVFLKVEYPLKKDDSPVHKMEKRGASLDICPCSVSEPPPKNLRAWWHCKNKQTNKNQCLTQTQLFNFELKATVIPNPPQPHLPFLLPRSCSVLPKHLLFPAHAPSPRPSCALFLPSYVLLLPLVRMED